MYSEHNILIHYKQIKVPESDVSVSGLGLS